MAREQLNSHFGELTFGPQHIDRNRHVNNAAYQGVFQDQRAACLQESDLSIDQITGGVPTAASFSGTYLSQVFEGDDMDLITRLEKFDEVKVRFMQRVYRKKDLAVGNNRYTSSLSYAIIPKDLLEAEPNEPSLYEYTEPAIVSPKVITDVGEPSSAHYFEQWERQRTNYLESLGITADGIEEQLSLLFVMPHYSGIYREPVSPGDAVTMKTSIEITKQWGKTQMLFRQKMTKDGKLAASFQCTVLMVDLDGKSVDLPPQIQEPIENKNLNVQ